ncbi:hypothetical protein REPUB_Repub03eG0015000 [Reevesia pubescens]
MNRIRRASHAGSWYTDNPKKLAEELDGWIRVAGLPKSSDVRGVIAPHAGYSYSGRAAAYAFGNIDPTNISRVFLLGPSHHYYTPKCALSTATVYKTPIGDLPIDLEVIEELKATGKFELMNLGVDEAEHSMEMHLPYLAKVFEGHPVKVVPILVGAVSAENESMYGKLLAKYIENPQNFFSVSSDFCHWGSRYVGFSLFFVVNLIFIENDAPKTCLCMYSSYISEYSCALVITYLQPHLPHSQPLKGK